MFRVIAIAVLLSAANALHPQQPQQGAVPSPDSPTPTGTIETAKELAGKGRLEAAMAQLDELSKQNPEPA